MYARTGGPACPPGNKADHFRLETSFPTRDNSVGKRADTPVRPYGNDTGFVRVDRAEDFAIAGMAE